MAERRHVTFVIDIDNEGSVRGARKLRNEGKKTDRQLRNIDRSTRKISSSMKIMSAVAVAGLGVVARQAGRAYTSTLELATSVEETSNKYNTVFGSAVGQVNQFLATHAELLGLSGEQSQAMASEIGDVVEGLGFMKEEASDTAVSVLKLAGDISSFQNVPIKQAVDALTGSLVGMRRPLRSLGIVIRETDVQQQAMLETGKRSVDNLTDQEKAQATLTLAKQRAASANGDLLRTMDATANKERRLQAIRANVSEQLATRFLPMLDTLVEVQIDVARSMSDSMQPIEEVSNEFNRQTRLVKSLSDETEPMLNRYDELTAKGKLSTREQEELNDIVLELAESVPTTAQEFDKYGNVIGVNTEKAREYIEQMRDLKKAMNDVEIQRLTTNMETQVQALLRLNESAETLRETGRGVMLGANPFGMQEISSLDDIEAQLDSRRASILQMVKSFKEMGFTITEIYNELPEVADALGSLWDNLVAGVEGEQEKRLAMLRENKEEVRDYATQLNAYKEDLDALVNSEGEWTAEKQRQATQIQRNLNQVEKEIQMRQDLIRLNLEAQSLEGKRGTSPISASGTAVEGDTLGVSTDKGSLDQQIQKIGELNMKKAQGAQRFEDTRQQHHENEMTRLNEQLEFTQQMFGQLTSFMGQIQQRRIQDIQEQKQAELSRIDAQLQNQRLSERQRENLMAERAEKEQELNEKIQKQKRKQFRLDKIAAVAEIAMNTAIAVSKVWGQTGIFGIAAQIPVLAMGALQTATVLAQPNPYLTGGLVQERLRDGLNNSESVISVSENNRPEFIMNPNSTRRSLPVLNRMNNDPNFARAVNDMATGNRTPVGGAVDSNIVAQAVREGMQNAVIEARIALSEFDEKYQRFRNNQRQIGN